ncbi:hypothetical protein [Amycolatopsis panacis]|uniref:hypothetical protein n=1 Tax=Amycolatopsis panacis TaxID=2340917 RepID=UPI0011C3BEDC|nr:hypothetical protein [Amycolatopsis panacis]
MLKLAGAVASYGRTSPRSRTGPRVGRVALCRFPQGSYGVTFCEGIELGKIEQGVRKQMSGRILDHRWQGGELCGRHREEGRSSVLPVRWAGVTGMLMNNGAEYPAQRPEDLVGSYEEGSFDEEVLPGQ